MGYRDAYELSHTEPVTGQKLQQVYDRLYDRLKAMLEKGEGLNILAGVEKPVAQCVVYGCSLPCYHDRSYSTKAEWLAYDLGLTYSQVDALLDGWMYVKPLESADRFYVLGAKLRKELSKLYKDE